MDEEAQALAERCHPHVPTALLAHLYRADEPFPVNTEPRAKLPVAAIRATLTCLQVEAMAEPGYLRYSCADCHSVMFQPYTHRGVTHAQQVDLSHKPDCCNERAARYAQTGVPPVWPDRLDG